MSIDWKARCAEHCGTIGKRDATIEQLQAQLEAEEKATLQLALDGGRMYTRIEKLEAQLSDATAEYKEYHRLFGIERKDKRKLQAQLEAVRPYLQHKSDCDEINDYTDLDAPCNCGLKAAIGEDEL